MNHIESSLPVSLSKEHEASSIEVLMKDFQSLSATNQRNARETELNNLYIIREIEKKINNKLYPVCVKTENSPQADSNFQPWMTRFCYIFTLSFGILQRAVGSYLFGSTIFLLIPQISLVLLITLSSLFVALDSLLFYAFEVSFLKSAMGMLDEPTEIGSLNQIYLDQRKVIKAINRELNGQNERELLGEELNNYSQCKNIFNAHLLEKLNSMETQPEGNWRLLCLEYAVITFGAFSSITDSYFAFTVLHLSFFTPIGAIVAIGFIISGLALFYGMGFKSFNKLINPDLEGFQKLKEKLCTFKDEFVDKPNRLFKPALEAVCQN